MSIINNGLLLASEAAGAGGYQVSRSLRFNSSDSAFCSRVFGTPTDRIKFTVSVWVKRAGLGTMQTIFRGGNADWADSGIYFDANNKLSFDCLNGSNAVNGRLLTTQVFRDCSAWYHIVAVWDSANGTAADRIQLWVNGSRITAFDVQTLPSLNAIAANLNTSGATHYLGSQRGTTDYLSAYLAEIHFIDGQALTPSSFAETNATTGQWVPKAYTGSYGTNGFKLDFADNSAATAAALGKDTSGNGNNWTPTNFSVTAGAGNDSVVDTPSSAGTDSGLGGQVTGNYATLNPLSAGPNAVLANGNLDWSTTQTGSFLAQSTIAMPSGKWYCEYTATSGNNMVGVQRAAGTVATSYVGGNADSWGYYGGNGNKYNNNSSSAYGAIYTTGDVVGIALDVDAGTLTFYKNGVSQGQAYSGLTNGPFTFITGNGANVSGTFNFGQRPFAYTAPSGFKALCDTNLPEGTITTSGTFTGNANADGPVVWLNGVPTVMTINGNAVTFGTHADKLANGFKLRSSSTSYNTAGSNTYSITTTGAKFKYARAQPNP